MFSFKEIESAKEFVDGLLKNKKVVVFAQSDCPQSAKTMKVLEQYEIADGALERVDVDKVKHKYGHIHEHINVGAVKEYLETLTGASAIPRVFIHGKFVGGDDDIVAEEKSGELEKMLNKADALAV